MIRPREALISLLRQLSVLFLWVNAWLYLASLIDLAFLGVFFVATALIALAAVRLRVRFLPALALAVLLPWVIRGLLFLVIPGVAGPNPSPWDSLYFWWDKNLFPLLAPGLLLWGATYLTGRSPRATPWERLLNAALLAGVFWIQGEYKNPTYAHPVFQALAVTAFLVNEAVILILYFKPQTGGRTKNLRRGRWARSLLPAVAILVPLFLLLFWALFTKYEEASVASAGGLMKPDLFRFDFSSFIKLESEISMNEDLVLLFRKEGTPEKRLLRRFILSGYSSDKGFFV